MKVAFSGFYTALNLPNSITLARIFAIPLVIWVVSTNHLSSVHGQKELMAAVVFAVAAITDGIDGRLARRRRQITTMGILLDPLADKLLVCSVLIVLVEFNPHLVRGWIVAIVVAREFLVTGLRGIAASEGYAIQASNLGKLKMVSQVVCVIAGILDHRWREAELDYHGFRFVLSIDLISKMSIYFMLAVSIISAIDYFVAFCSRGDRARREVVVLSHDRSSEISVPVARG